MFQKLAYFKCVSLIMLAGKVFVDGAMFAWYEIFGVVLIPAIISMSLDTLSAKFDSWIVKLNGQTS